MNSKRLAGLVVLIFAFIMGCSGNYGKLKTQSDIETKLTQQELINNWPDYHIRYNHRVIVFDPKKDDKKILVGNSWGTVKDQETWTRLVNGNERLPTKGYTNQVWGNEIREIRFTDNRLYGYVTYQPNELVSTQIVDENKVRLWHGRSEDRRNF